jgi:glycine cleavage system H protein
MMRFAQSHEWIELKGKIGTVGISNHAQKELGEVVYIELPKVGAFVKAGVEVCVLESTKAASDVYTPVSGKIVQVNEKLKNDPSLINQGAESSGWLFQVELSDPNELDRLMTRNQYKALVS